MESKPKRMIDADALIKFVKDCAKLTHYEIDHWQEIEQKYERIISEESVLTIIEDMITENGGKQ